MLLTSIMKLATLAENNAINVSAVGTTVALSLTRIYDVVNGVLPSLGIIAGIICTVSFAIYHIKNGQKVDAERKKAELELELLQRKLDELN